jgi:uncharacterized repeat protein (TIGR03803 family)
MKTISTYLEGTMLALVTMAVTTLMVQSAAAQTWVTNSPLQVARWSHTATLLPNGLVLIAGGETTNRYDIPDSAFRGTASAELYDPSTGSSTLTGSMSQAHYSDIATLLPNGLVLVAGGRNDGGGIVTGAELYDSAAGTWTDTGDMNQDRSSFTATLLPNGKVLVIAGYTDSGESSSAEIYDPGTGVWMNVAPMNYSTDSQTATLLTNGLVLVAGGSDGLGGALTNSVLYNPANNTWTNTGPLNEARAGHAATLLTNGTVLVVGGAGDNTCEIFNPATATWSLYANMNDGWYNPNAVLLNNGQVMVVGDGNSDVELYNPAANTWTYTDFLPVPGGSQTATLLPSGQVLVTGGSSYDTNVYALDAVQTYGSAIVAPSLAVTASPTSGLTPLTVQFSSPGTDSDGNTMTNWNWNFGDGTTSTAQNPSHTYNFGGYSPSLTAYSTFGATPLNVTGLGAIYANLPYINADATPQSGQAPLTVQFSSPGQDNGGFTVTNWSWTFGDGTTSTARNPAHTYINPGTYSPSLVAYSTHSSSPLYITYGYGTIAVTNPPNPYFKTLYSFTASSGSPVTNSDGTGPNGGLVLSGHTLYGTAQHGGITGYGALFAVNTDGSSFTNLYNFSLSPNSGAIPPAGVILSGSTFFGTTYFGGNRSGGTIFAIGTNGLGYTNLLNYNFNIDPNSGEEPQAGVVMAGGTLYGTTWYGGAYDHGTLSYVTTNGATTGILHHFSTPSGHDANLNSDGLFPSAKLIVSGATLYGTAEGGGNYAAGTVFAIETNSPGSFRILHYFTATIPQYTGTNTDGANPFAGLVLSGNTLYGATVGGGQYGYGTVFAVSTNGLNFTNLYNFTGGTDGSGPRGGLTLSGNILYGTTSGGSGTLFSIHTDGSGFATLYQFSGGYDGANPQGDLLLSSNALYGAAASGGSSGNGTVFSFSLSATALPVTLLNPTNNGVNFQFQFLSESGFNHNILYRTNLVVGNWLTNSTVIGDGTVKIISIPYSLFSPSKQGFIRVSTQ